MASTPIRLPPAKTPGIAIRPLTLDDEPAYRSFCARLEPEDIRLRFGRMIARIETSCLRRLIEIDHDREEAFAAVDGSGAILGIGRIAGFDRPEIALPEIALIVRSDLKRRGLGRLLLERVLRYGIERGFSEITGFVMAENRPMLELARHIGFRINRTALGTELEVRLCLP
jgi:acetyltransferase